MMEKKGSAYTGGVIAVREKKLLRDKIVRLCGMSAEEALRTLSESGFGGGDTSLSPEELVLADEREIDEFICEYAPSRRVKEYLLAPRDFHNAKALVKARHLNTDAAPLLGSVGTYSVEELARAVDSGDTAALPKELQEAIKSALALLEEENPSGADAGFLFDSALYGYLNRVLGRGVCKRLLARRADMTNLLTAFRAPSIEEAEKYFVCGGALDKKQLSKAFGETEQVKKSFEKTDYAAFVEMLCAARDNKKPFTEAEREKESFELGYFSKRPYELSGQGTFLYYIFRRRAENENVRVVLVCLSAGLKEGEIVKRLRGVK